MKLSWRVSCLVTALVLLLAACGTGGTDTSPTAEPSASEAAASEPAATASEPTIVSSVSGTRMAQAKSQRNRLIPKGGSASERGFPNTKLPAQKSGARARKT